MSADMAPAAESGNGEPTNVQPEAAPESLNLPRPGRSIVPEEGQAEKTSGSEPTVEERVRQDPEFAWNQVQVRDQKIADLGKEVHAFREIKPFIDAAGNVDSLLGFAALGQRIQSTPGLQELVQTAIQTGELPGAKAPEPDPDEDLWDADVKKVRDQLRAEMSEMKTMIQSALGNAEAAHVRSTRPDVRANMDAALKRFEGVPEGHEEALSLIESKVQQAMRLAEQGDAAQQKLVEQIAGDGGQRVIDYMLFEAGLHDKYGSQIYAPDQTPDPEPAVPNGGRVLGTEPRHVNPSRPAAPPLPPLERGQVARNPTGTAMAVFDEIRRRRGH